MSHYFFTEILTMLLLLTSAIAEPNLIPFGLVQRMFVEHILNVPLAAEEKESASHPLLPKY